MQAIAPVTIADLLAPVQRMRYKLEVYDDVHYRTDFLAGWPRRQLIALPIPTANLTDFPEKVPIVTGSPASIAIGAHCLANGYDIRFTAIDGVTLLPYERESFAVVAGEATGIFWVKSDVAMAGTHIWCYYGNAAAADVSEVVRDTEYVVNGGFDSVVAPWEPYLCTIAIIAGGQGGGGCLELSNAGTTNPVVYQYPTGLSIGITYRISGYVKSGSSGDGGFRVYYGSSYYINATSSGTWVKHSGQFTAAATTNELDAYALGDIVGTRLFDSISIKIFHSTEWSAYEDAQELLADGGLTWGAEETTVLAPATWYDFSSLAGEDYLKSVSLSLGGAGMETAPIAGTWSATIDNPLGIFHPKHPTSFYANLLRVGREVRIWVGGNYGGVDYYWQRLIGFMDAPRFDHGSHTVEIGGMDYMKLLADTELRSPENYWGSDICIPTIATIQTLGAEIYAEGDAMDIAADAANVAGWTILNNAVFTDEAPAGAPSTNVGKLERDVPGTPPYAANDNVGAFTAGSTYVVTFKYARKAGSTAGELTCGLYESGTWTLWGQLSGLTSMAWATASFQFTAGATANGRMKFTLNTEGDPLTYFYIDEISIKEKTGTGFNATYELPSDSCGPYYVTLEQQSGSGSGCLGSGGSGTPMWFADGLNGWYYDEATKVISFNSEKVVDDNDSLLVYYYTTQVPENVVADLMVTAGLYATRAAALADMSYTATGITIDRVWFDAGTTCLAAIQKICERLDYRFWFAYDGQPHFQPAPVAGAVDFDFPDAGDLMDIANFQDISMVRNYIVIEGIEQAMYADTEKTQKSRFVGTEHDDTSITAYLEKTYAITNNLFQDQASVDAMAVALLADYKDPAWYADLQLAFNPVPLELGDTISWVLELEPTDEVGGSGSLEVAMTGIIRDIKINDGISNYKVEVTEPGSGS
jgi:hypothetical protein